MKLGVFTCLLGNLPLEEALGYFKSKGLEMVEIGCGGYPGNSHADPDTLLADPSALSTFKSTVADSGLEISALSCHGNPIHPNKAIAADFDRTIKNTILLAEKLGIQGTPATLIGDEMLSGWIPWEQFDATIGDALKKQ